ncbi:MAG: hypothetical protein ACREA3_04945 [Nitrosotalea sp.]
MGLFGRSKQKDEAVEQLKMLFDKFEYTDIEKFCKDVIGKVPQSSNERPERIQLLEFIWKHYREGDLNFQQVKDFAIKDGIVTSNFFD